MVGKTEKPTAEQQVRLKRIASLPCICCQREGIKQPNRTEVHHVISHGYRKHSGGHDSTIGLCVWHHRGLCLDDKTSSEMLFDYGPSLALYKRQFVKTYGTERELLARLEAGVQSAHEQDEGYPYLF